MVVVVEARRGAGATEHSGVRPVAPRRRDAESRILVRVASNFDPPHDGGPAGALVTVVWAEPLGHPSWSGWVIKFLWSESRVESRGSATRRDTASPADEGARLPSAP